MFEIETEVKLHDTDAAGIVFFANHFKIAHGAYEAFMNSIECSLDHVIRESDYLIPIVHAEADYRGGLSLGDKCFISMRADVGTTSFTLFYAFTDVNGKITAQIQTVHVTVNKGTGEKVSLPDKLKAGLLTIS
jgi:YbgC/YbaW family acyl-CoA thioester hydrolase